MKGPVEVFTSSRLYYLGDPNHQEPNNEKEVKGKKKVV